MNSTRDGAGARLARLHTLFWLTAGLSACGGGGPNTGESPFPVPAPSPAPASATAQSCAPTNPYRADALQPTTSGSLANEKAWLRRYMDAAYLWTAQIPSVNAGAAPYSDTGDVPGSLDRYFEALKTPALTASGKRLDQFSFTYPTKAWNDLFQAGEEAGYGALWAIGSDTPPRSIRIVRVEAGSPAALAGLRRGDTLVSVDGVSADTLDPAGIDTLNSGLYPGAAGESHRFVVSRGAGTLDVSLRSAVITQNPVPLTKDEGEFLKYLSKTVAPPRIAEAPVAFECRLHEKLETESRYVFIGRIVHMAARDGLIDTTAWRVNLREYHPVGRFGASFYTRTNERFSIADPAQNTPSNTTAIDQM